jgi:hypothetical protein
MSHRKIPDRQKCPCYLQRSSIKLKCTQMYYFALQFNRILSSNFFQKNRFLNQMKNFLSLIFKLKYTKIKTQLNSNSLKINNNKKKKKSSKYFRNFLAMKCLFCKIKRLKKRKNLSFFFNIKRTKKFAFVKCLLNRISICNRLNKIVKFLKYKITFFKTRLNV